MRLPRALVFNVVFYLWTLAMMLWALATTRGRPQAIRRLSRFWSRSSLWLLSRIVGLDREIIGEELLPPPPYIVAAKHQSAWDILALAALFPDGAIVLKQELLRIPLFGWLSQRAGHIAVDRSGGGRALAGLVAAARRVAAEGRPVVLFPQGTRVPPGETRPYQVGVAALYAELGLPVVPLALNSGLFWPRRWPVQRPGTVRVRILASIAPGLEKRVFLDRLASATEDATRELEDRSGR